MVYKCLMALHQVGAESNSSYKTIQLYFTFLKLWLTIIAGDMASLIDKAKHFVSDAVASKEKPQACVTDVDLNGVSLGCVNYLAKIKVTNPYSVSIPICEIRYILKSSGGEIGSGTVPDPGSLKGDEDTMLNVNIKVPHSVLVSLVKDISRDWDIDYDLKVTLVVDLPLIGEISIPITSAGEIKLPSLSDFWKKDAE